MDQATKNLLVIGGIGLGDPGRQLLNKVLEQAGSRRCQIHMTDQQLFVDLAPEELKDRFSALDVLDFSDPAACAEWAAEQVRAGARYDLVVTARDDAQAATAAVARALGLPYNSERSIEVTQNKDQCRDLLSRAGFRQPRWRLCTGTDDARTFVADTDGPWVVKPRNGTGSRAVRRMDSVGELDGAMSELTDEDRSLFLVEEFVEGSEYSAEGVFVHGIPRVIALTAKETTAAPVFVETGHVVPAPLAPDVAARIRDDVERAVQAVGLTFGLFHAEFWITRDGVVLGEMHCRPGGDYITTLIEEALPRFEYFGAFFDGLFDPNFAPDLTACGAASVAFLTADPGEVVEILGWDEAATGAEVIHTSLARETGDHVTELRSSLDRCGAILARGETPDAARAAARSRADAVRIVTK